MAASTARPAEPTDLPAARTDRRWWLRSVGVPAGLYLVTRVLQLWMVAALAAGDTVAGRLMAWDAGWYVRIAEHGYEPGYTYDDTGALVGNGLAFFPLYPMLVRVVSWVPGVSVAAAALAVSWIAGTAAAVLLSLLGTRLRSRRTGYALAVLFGAQPMSVVLSMGYSEALFCALAAGALLAAYHQAWLTAGGLGALAALTRPTGMALAAGLVAWGAWLSWRGGGRQPLARMSVALAACLAAGPAYLLWVGQRVGDWDGWFRIQRLGWGTRWDFGASTWAFLRETFTRADGWVQVSTAVIIVGAAVAVLAALSERVWLPLSLYGVLAFAMAVGSSGYFHSRPRLLVTDLLLLLPLAMAVARCRPRTAALLLAGATLLGCWYGAYMVTVWPYAI